MFGIGATELVVLLILALIIFGPGKLPEVGKALGKTMREFKRASSAVEDEVKSVSQGVKDTGQNDDGGAAR